MRASDLIKRLGYCKKIETSLQIEELVLQKTSNKYMRELNKAEAALKTEQATRDTKRRQLRALEKTNKKVKILLQREERKIENNSRVEAEYENRTKMLADERMREHLKKECTLSFLNKRQLPAAAQGMNVCQGQFVPYKFSINRLNMTEVPLEFWNQTQTQNIDANHWDDLVFNGINLN